jgi:hypothetical protein
MRKQRRLIARCQTILGERSRAAAGNLSEAASSTTAAASA